MATFRAESVLDINSNNYYVEIYYPADSEKLLVRTDPIYPSHEIAESETLRIFKEALPNQPTKGSKS